MKLLAAGLATVFALIPAVHAVPTHQFDHFFPGWDWRVQDILKGACAEPYAVYLTGKVNETEGKQSIVNPVIDCILTEFPESRKAECKHPLRLTRQTATLVSYESSLRAHSLAESSLI